MTQRSVTLFIPTLASGGAERATLNLALALTTAGCKVTILVQRLTGALVAEVPKHIPVISLQCGRTLSSLLPLIRYLKQTKPDFFIANMGHGNIISLWARALSKVPTRVIACQHSVLSAEVRTHKNWRYKILPWLYRHFLIWADAIVTVSQNVAYDLSAFAHIPTIQFTTIYNAVIGPNFEQRMRQPCPHPWFGMHRPPVILGVGRLSEEKDFATLIKAFAKAQKVKDLRLILLGEGKLLNDLKLLADKLGVEEFVSFAGYQANPLPYISRAAALVVSSRYEGMSNVLVEALACGTNVVSTNCPGGPIEILDKDRYGTLVHIGDDDAMSRAMLAAISHPLKKEFLQERGQEFTFERTARAYIKLFDQLAAEAQAPSPRKSRRKP